MVKKKKLNVVLMGGSAVGKASLMEAAVQTYEDKAPSSQKTTSTSKGKSTKVYVELDDTQYELQLSTFYDTGLTDEEIKLVQQADGFIVVFDLTNKFSLDRVLFYRKKIEKSSVDPPSILVGNKSDLKYEREVDTTEGLKLADEFGCTFFETCATNNFKGVDEVFKEIIKVVEAHKKKNPKSGDKDCLLM
eukprot:gene3161-5477_t